MARLSLRLVAANGRSSQRWTTTTRSGSRPIDHEIMDGHAREARRLFTVLEINGLATTKTEVSTTIGGEPGGIILEREVALRMAACMKR